MSMGGHPLPPLPAPGAPVPTRLAFWGNSPAALLGGWRSGLTGARHVLAGERRELSSAANPAAHILCVVLRGAGHLRLRLGGDEVYAGRLGAGEIITIPAGSAAHGVLEDFSFDCLDLHLPIRTVAAALEDELGGNRDFELTLPVHSRDGELDLIGRRVAAEMDAGHPASRILLDGLALELISLLVRRWSNLAIRPDRVRGGLVPYHLRRVTEYLVGRLQDDVSLEEAAAVTGLSTKHFARAFRQSTGLAPHQWLIQQRVERAKSMLAGGEHGLADIALSCGFADQSHFTATFRRATGITPGAWRRERS